MIFADKLIQLRKKSGLSQEELAAQMNVTRQSVSKWEGAQSIPDYDRMIQLSKYFGVSIDYLLKDEIEDEEFIEGSYDDIDKPIRVSMEEASAFLNVKEETAKTIAYATVLCIISPITLFILGAMSETDTYNISESFAAGIGLVILLVLVCIAVAIFIYSGSKTSSYEYLETEPFDTEYGVRGMVEDRKRKFNDRYTKGNIIGVCLCIFAAIPVITGGFVAQENGLLMMMSLVVTILLVAGGVYSFIRVGIVQESYLKLLQEGEYSKRNKKNSTFKNALYTAYWMIATAIYLGYSFFTRDFKNSWVVWPIAGVLFPAVVAIINAFDRKD